MKIKKKKLEAGGISLSVGPIEVVVDRIAGTKKWRIYPNTPAEGLTDKQAPTLAVLLNEAVVELCRLKVEASKPKDAQNVKGG